MLIFELTILAITYSALIIAIFLEVLCFKRKMETIETIAFTASLLLLVISISLSPLFGENEIGSTSAVFTLICMTLVSSTTFLITLSERHHTIKPIYKRAHIYLAASLIIGVLVTYLVGYLVYVQYAVIVFLICSIAASMIIVRVTKPLKRFAHLEKSSRFFAITFLILVPFYLIFHYGFEREYEKLPMGFLLYMAFILLAVSKIYDDLQRLSLIRKGVEPQKQHFKNYGLTEREEEIATLLSKGITYQSISEQLFISLPTVKTHAGSIYKKCGVKTRHELTLLLIH